MSTTSPRLTVPNRCGFRAAPSRKPFSGSAAGGCRCWGRMARAICWCECTSGRRSGLTDEQERLFRDLAKVEGEAPKRAPGFWSKLKEALGA